MSQIALPLAWPADPRDDDFLISASNREAVTLLDRWGTWPVKAALLVGPRKSGRSLLARVFAAKSGGAILDDADARPEAELFHAWNLAQAERRPLLLVAQVAPPAWRIALPDLRSRLAASPVAAIGAPDDVLVAALLGRYFDRRRIVARPETIAWIAARIERSHVAVERAVDVVDAALVERRRRATVALARTVLADAALIAA